MKSLICKVAMVEKRVIETAGENELQLFRYNNRREIAYGFKSSVKVYQFFESTKWAFGYAAQKLKAACEFHFPSLTLRLNVNPISQERRRPFIVWSLELGGAAVGRSLSRFLQLVCDPSVQAEFDRSTEELKIAIYVARRIRTFAKWNKLILLIDWIFAQWKEIKSQFLRGPKSYVLCLVPITI